MKRLLIAALFAAITTTAFAQQPVTLVDAAKANKELSSFSAALTAAGVDTLIMSSGPYTIFAPDNLALNKAPGAATGDILKYHVIRGDLDAAKLKNKIGEGVDGKYTFVTLSGHKIWASIVDGRIKLTDEKGMSAWVTTPDIKAGNGVIHMIDGILMPGPPASVEQ